MEIRTRDLVLRTVGPGDIDETARMWDFEHGDIPRDEALKVLGRMEENHSRKDNRLVRAGRHLGGGATHILLHRA